MLARVTTWEGGTAEGLRSAAATMQERVKLGPPTGLKSKGVTMLVDPEGGRALIVGMFETETDLEDSLPVLKQMNPPEGIGSMTSATIYEVAAEVRM